MWHVVGGPTRLAGVPLNILSSGSVWLSLGLLQVAARPLVVSAENSIRGMVPETWTRRGAWGSRWDRESALELLWDRWLHASPPSPGSPRLPGQIRGGALLGPSTVCVLVVVVGVSVCLSEVFSSRWRTGLAL